MSIATKLADAIAKEVEPSRHTRDCSYDPDPQAWSPGGMEDFCTCDRGQKKQMRVYTIVLRHLHAAEIWRLEPSNPAGEPVVSRGGPLPAPKSAKGS